MTSRRDHGQVMAFTIVMMLTLLLMSGLVVDGGLALTAKVKAINIAQEAARAGTQQLDLTALRTTGRFILDENRAQKAARRHLTAAEATGSITVTPEEVRVTARIRQPSQILQLATIRTFTLTGTATASPQPGIDQPLEEP